MPTPHPWHIADRAIAFKARRWQVERSLRRPPGSADSHEFFTLRMPDFVQVIAVTPADELVMVRQFRHGVESVRLEFPGGLLDPGESPAAAAARELLEETGYTTDALTELPLIHPAAALQNNRSWFFVGRNARRQASQHLEETEDIAVELVPRSQALARIRAGEITDANHLAGLLLFLSLHPEP